MTHLTRADDQLFAPFLKERARSRSIYLTASFSVLGLHRRAERPNVVFIGLSVNRDVAELCDLDFHGLIPNSQYSDDQGLSSVSLNAAYQLGTKTAPQTLPRPSHPTHVHGSPANLGDQG